MSSIFGCLVEFFHRIIVESSCWSVLNSDASECCIRSSARNDESNCFLVLTEILLIILAKSESVTVSVKA